MIAPGDLVICVAPDEEGLLKRGGVYTVRGLLRKGRYCALDGFPLGLFWQLSRFKKENPGG